ncbi:division/cell wall cluster transcriptional repressor MraZ [Altererythrobacter aestuarii]|uniref:Division/cell wall cluster transcriptional repressor MraZ n=1 Tax=Alteraurantiacibacter aestuarii TaxID=650004 RepID=A0A844ZTQ6_9SPHN|nr:division/cell wall cluster transcriptional repressor MraZ [Alteraurantiacibacter aestuarii]
MDPECVGLGEVTQAVAGFSGQGFSLRGEKDRFVLPPEMRNPIAEASDERVLCVGKHDSWPCLVGFGSDRIARFDEILAQQQEEARQNGDKFDRAIRSGRLWSFKRHSFDASGRFVLNPSSVKLGKIEDKLYFHGVGDVITIWNPDILMGLGDDFDFFKIYCEQEMAEAAAKGRGK